VLQVRKLVVSVRFCHNLNTVLVSLAATVDTAQDRCPPSSWELNVNSPVVSYFFISIFFPRLFSAVADWMSIILPHMMWRFSANLGCRSEMCGSLEIQDAKIAKNSPSGHNRRTLSGCIVATKTHIDNQKKI